MHAVFHRVASGQEQHRHVPATALGAEKIGDSTAVERIRREAVERVRRHHNETAGFERASGGSQSCCTGVGLLTVVDGTHSPILSLGPAERPQGSR